MRFCPSFQIVELIREGRSPQHACDCVVKRIVANCGKSTEVALIALDMKVCTSETVCLVQIQSCIKY